MDACKMTIPLAREERLDDGATAATCRWVEVHPLFQALMDSVDGYLMILDARRRVLAVNPPLLALLGGERLAEDRPGHVLGCVHAPDAPDGCGGGPACATCGVEALLRASQRTGEPAAGECQATVRRGAEVVRLDLRVRATPLRVEERDFTALVLRDLGADRLRETREEIFFQQALETADLLLNWSGLLNGYGALNPKEAGKRILNLAWRLKQEIEAQAPPRRPGGVTR